MKTLLLVDASSYLYRAFHALPDLRNKRGEPTGAVYGVINMLRRLHKEVAADYSACVFDAKGKTFRDDWYPEYKANRPPMPDDMRMQIGPLHDCVRALGWPMLEVEGVEADDVIGTLAKTARVHGIRTLISSGDKDLTQLVDPLITMVNTMSNETFDEAGVMAKFGVKPTQIIDYLTLIGDSVDNVPGVEKVGPKTAVKWLTQYGSLDAIVANAGQITGVVGENLRKAKDWLPQARRLLTVKCDVELPLPLESLHYAAPDNAALKGLFERLEFKTWLRELQAEAPVASVPTAVPAVERPPRRYTTVLDAATLETWMARIEQAPLVSVDTETTSLDPLRARIVGISLSVEAHEGAYIPLVHRYPGAPVQLDLTATLTRLKPWLENPVKSKVGQNAKYDTHVFANHGVALRGVVHDTLLQSYVLESHKPHDMDSMADRHLGVKTILYTDVAGKGASQIGFEQVAIEKATAYAAEDSDVTLQLHQTLYPRIESDDKLRYIYEIIEMPCMQVLRRVERNGVLLDVPLLEAQSHQLGTRLLELESQAHQLAGRPFNLGSPKQIQEILFDQLKLPVIKKTPTGQPSTDEDVLQTLALDYPLPKVLLDHRGLAKLKSTYTDKLPRMVNPNTGRVHTNYAQSVAVTGRLSSTDPNLQNIPVRTAEGRRIREAFIAPSGSLIVSADYSQIELRIMAHLSCDAGLLQAFATGQDVHRHTASEVFGVERDQVTSEQRRYAKAINFGLIYGMSAFGLAGQLGVERGAAQQYMDRYFARYPGVAAYMQRTRETARENGYVETVFGRRLFLPEIRSSNVPRRQGAERAAINAPMQGTAADLIKLAMIAVQKWLDDSRMTSRLLMQVHDELVLEVPDAELESVRTQLPALMSGVATLSVPLSVELGAGPNWEKAH